MLKQNKLIVLYAFGGLGPQTSTEEERCQLPVSYKSCVFWFREFYLKLPLLPDAVMEGNPQSSFPTEAFKKHHQRKPSKQFLHYHLKKCN